MRKACVTWKVNQINKMYENGNLTFDNIIQRNYVWNNNEQSSFIDSIMRNFPVSVIYTIKTNETIKTKKGISNIYDCLDGKQRCTTIYRFLHNEFYLTGLDTIITKNGEELDFNGKYFKDLDKYWQDKITEYGMTIYYFTKITDEEIIEMMSRLNKGKPLSGIENARIKAKNLHTIKNLAIHPVITNNLTTTAIRNYVNEDIIIKTTLLLNNITNLNNANVRMAYETYDFNDEMKSELVEILNTADLIIKCITNAEFKKTTLRKITSKTNFITILYAISKYKDVYNVKELANAIYNFYNNITDKYMEANKAGTMRSTNVIIRNEELAKFIKTTVEERNKVVVNI